MVTKLRNVGANVIVHGQNWNEADALAQEALAQEEDAFYIPPYGEASNMSLSHSVTYALTLNYN